MCMAGQEARARTETGVFFQTPKDIKDEKKKDKSLGSVKLISSDSILSLLRN